jgi:inosine-uridine nucleoside N-ribohydrolase
VLDLIFDMETQDPDDVLTLCLLATHPGVRLRAVTIQPGSRVQVGIVRHLLETRLSISGTPIGSRAPDFAKDAVSGFHRKWLGDIDARASDPDGEAHDVLARAFTEHPRAAILTGAPVHNLRLLLQNHPDVRIARWIAQGGFAGDSVVPPEHRLEKFAGKETCPTFNFNGDPKGALLALSSANIASRDLVSKNVCHGPNFTYDRAFHERLAGLGKKKHPGLALVHEAMELYLIKENKDGKMLHDPLAACIAIDRSIATFREVEVYRASNGEWGSRLLDPEEAQKSTTSTFITIAADRERFFDVFSAS